VDGTPTDYQNCRLCPRDCRVDRSAGRAGACGESAAARLAWAGLHRGEEPPLTGENGSGTVFFTGCTLRCSFCQNRQISREGLGREVVEAELAAVFLDLERAGAANVNLVTGTPHLPRIEAALTEARRRGLGLPVVWNSSGYETEAAVERLARFVDVFLPDLKTLDPGLARRYFRAVDYPAVAARAVRAMADIAPAEWDGDRLRRGMVLRHLVLPGHLDATRAVLEFYVAHLREKSLLSLMVQYLPPCPGAEPAGRLGESDFETILGWLDELGIEEGYLQDLDTESPWIPDFTRDNPFPPGFGRPVWQWQTRKDPTVETGSETDERK
jgi:putative pyruvate formate lyase activating enzyme